MKPFYERNLRTALSQIMDAEVNPADVARVLIRYRPGTAEFSIAVSAVYQQLLLNGGALSCPGCGNGNGPAA